jgi:hypothetical protein
MVNFRDKKVMARVATAPDPWWVTTFPDSTPLTWSGGIEARTGLRMMPTFPRSPQSFRTAGFPQYGWRAGVSDETFPARQSA